MNYHKTAVITGGSEGIGLAVAKTLVRSGYCVFICGRTNQKLQEAVKEIGPECKAEALDVSVPSQARRLIERAALEFGRIDLLVNNAGAVFLRDIETITSEMFSAMLDTNIGGVFNTCQAVWPLMRRQGGGAIVNVSSLSAFDPFEGLSVYGGTKAWVNTFSKALSIEGRRTGIRVFSVCPGAVETNMLRRLFPDHEGEVLSPEKVAQVIAALARKDLSPCSGESIRVAK